MAAPATPILATLPSAFAAACRISRNEGELLDRCRAALVRRFECEQIWFTTAQPNAAPTHLGPASGLDAATEVCRLTAGETQLVIAAAEPAAGAMRPAALQLALGLSVVLDLRAVLEERQAQLDDALFQLRALRQVARLLSSAHSSEETEQLVLDFMAEVFFAWWACLYRPTTDTYRPHLSRSVEGQLCAGPIVRSALDALLPAGSAPVTVADAGLARLLQPEAQLVVPLDAGAERMGLMVLGPRISDRSYGRAELELAGTLAFAGAIALKNASLVEQLHSAATTDQLTGLYNRRALEERLGAEISRSLRHQLHTSVVLIDLDRFKNVNDSLGHPGGDRLLVLVGGILRQQARTLDVVGRLGGDEFLAILPMTSPEEARIYIGRVETSLREMYLRHPEYGQVSLSIGIAESPRHGTTVSSLLAAADAALYKVKRSGRATIAVAD